MKTLRQIVEMAGPGKRGPKTKAQKEAEAKESEEKEKRESEYKAKRERERHHHDTSFAPSESKKFKHELEDHLNANGFHKIHEGPKRSIYTKIDHGNEHHHIVTVENPKGHSSFDKHGTEVKYNNHSGASYSSIHYRPREHEEEDIASGKAHEHESKNRAEALHKLNKLYTGQTFRIED